MNKAVLILALCAMLAFASAAEEITFDYVEDPTPSPTMYKPTIRITSEETERIVVRWMITAEDDSSDVPDMAGLVARVDNKVDPAECKVDCDWGSDLILGDNPEPSVLTFQVASPGKTYILYLMLSHESAATSG